MKSVVPVCNDCDKPWMGRKNSYERCWCDPSSSYREEEIETDYEEELKSSDEG